MPGVKLHTSLDPRFSCAICGVSIDGHCTTHNLMTTLFDRYKDPHGGDRLREDSLHPRHATRLHNYLRTWISFVGAMGEIAASKKA